MSDDADITITAPLLIMICKRKWILEDPIPTYRTTVKGLSVFVVGSVLEAQVVLINETMEVLKYAKTMTANEYKEVTHVFR